MVAAKHCYSMSLGTMFHSLEHISDLYDMVEGGTTLEWTALPYYMYTKSFIWIRKIWAPPTVVASYMDVIPDVIHASSSSMVPPSRYMRVSLDHYYHWSWWWVMVMAGFYWLCSNFTFKTDRWCCDPTNSYTHLVYLVHIYKEFKHVLLPLQQVTDIRMSHTDVSSLSCHYVNTRKVCWKLVLIDYTDMLWLGHPTHFIYMTVLIYIQCVRTTWTITISIACGCDNCLLINWYSNYLIILCIWLLCLIGNQ